jgi:hypothetical protein
MMRCIHGAYRLAGGIVAVLAQHGEKPDDWLLLLEVPFDPKPQHLTAFKDPPLAYDGHIVFGAACNHTGSAADTAIEVHCHAPSEPRVTVRCIEILMEAVSFWQRKSEVGLMSRFLNLAIFSQRKSLSDFPSVLVRAAVSMRNGYS